MRRRARQTGFGAKAALLGAVIALSAGAARAEERAVFDITLLGFRAATLSFAGVVQDGAYAASGQLRSTGIARVVAKVAFDAQVRGVVRAGFLLHIRAFWPARPSRRRSVPTPAQAPCRRG